MKNGKEQTKKIPQLAELTINRASDAIFWIDSEARFQHVNDTACRNYGFSREEFLSLTVYDINPEVLSGSWPEFWEKFKERKVLTFESCHRTKKGRIFPVELSCNYFEFEDKEYACSFARDITERKKAENEIASLAKFPSENPNPVLRVSKEGKIIYANLAGSPLLKAWDCKKDGTLPDEWRNFISGVFRSGSCKEIETPCGERVFLVLFSPIVNSGYVCMYGRDVTERKEAEEALRVALSEVEQLKNRLHAENVYLREEIKIEHNFDEIITRGNALKKVLRQVEQVASTNATVLILGETGTGKELLARAIHNISPRRDRPLVKVNCAALPANLVESELFGHDKGAFTGALSSKIGRFELADGGTIFLDEIGEMPLELQVKLLRILQEGEFERLGSPITKKIDVRVIAATNRDLVKAMEKGDFREDLYYRLNVFPIKSPSLRERKEDIPLLARHFTQKHGSKVGKNIESVPQKVMERLQAYRWPGNVRELENIIERAVIVSHGKRLDIGDWLPKNNGSSGAANIFTLEEREREHILEILKLTEWRVSGEKGAARVLAIKPTTLESRMKKLNIKRRV